MRPTIRPVEPVPRPGTRVENRPAPRAPRDVVYSTEPGRVSDTPREHPADREIPVCGVAAVRALFKARPTAIKRLFFDAIQGRRAGAMSGYLAGQRRIYRQVEPAELEKIAGTVHHGGIVAIIDQLPPAAPTDADVKRWAKASADVVLLDRIGNAHNLGAIARTLAFFGVEHLVVSADEKAARPGESTYRVAEGGLEHVTVWVASDLAALCRALREAGFAVVGADVRGKHLKALRRREFSGKPVASKPTPPPSPAPAAAAGAAKDEKPAHAKPQPVALVVGNEEAGLAPEVVQACEKLVRIPGSEKMESLNVSAATAVLVAALRSTE